MKIGQFQFSILEKKGGNFSIVTEATVVNTQLNSFLFLPSARTKPLVLL